ncbi:hypothetical protein D3C87_1660190 [compost metagenome]
MTGNLFVDLYFFLNTFSDFFKSQFNFNTQVASTCYAAATTLTSATATEETFEGVSATKDITKLAKYVIHIHAATTAVATTC